MDYPEMPEGWAKSGNLLYTGEHDGLYRGKQQWRNRLTVRVDGTNSSATQEEVDALTDSIYAFLTSPAASSPIVESGPPPLPSVAGAAADSTCPATYLPDETKMKALGYTLYLPNPEKPYPAHVGGTREWEIVGNETTDFIKVYHQYGYLWIGCRYHHGALSSTLYNGVLPNEAFFDQLLKLNGRYPL